VKGELFKRGALLGKHILVGSNDMLWNSVIQTLPVVGAKTLKSALTGLYPGIAALGLALFGVVSTAQALPITLPTGLNPGDQYRLAFVTSGLRDAMSSNIADYNNFVSAAANSQAVLAALGTTWKAIASTNAVDAQDNTGTNPNNATGVPIYLLDGTTKIANDNAGLWVDYLIAPLDITEAGTAVGSSSPSGVWTGTTTLGAAISGAELGASLPFLGLAPWVSPAPGAWINFNISPNTEEFHLYALSDFLIVAGRADGIPEPGTLFLYGIGLAFFALLRRRRRQI